MTRNTKKQVDSPQEPTSDLAASIFHESLTAILFEIRGIRAGKVKPKGHDAASRIELSSQANWCSQVGEIVSFLGRCDVQDSCSCGVQDGSSRNLALKASAAGRQSKGVRHSRDGYGERDVCPYGDDGPRAYGVRVGRSRHERDGGATCDAASAPSIDVQKRA